MEAVFETLDKYFIVGIAWGFGVNGNNFIKTMLNIGKKYDTLRVVNNLIETPTYTLDLARLLVDMGETEKYGITTPPMKAVISVGIISHARFSGRQVILPLLFQSQQKNMSELSKAARPFNSRLDKSKLTENGFESLPDWKDALRRYLEEIQ